jgi:hypothetical protein
MRRFGLLGLSLLLAAGIHVDWHLARPHHHRLSADWGEHWIFAIVLFALAGCAVARAWPAERVRLGAWVLGAAVVLAQVVEPLLEAAFYDRTLAYDVEPARWTAFFVCLGAGIPSYALALWLCARPVPRLRAAG